MTIDTVVDLQIVVSASAPSQTNFGMPLLCAYHTAFAELTRLYGSLDEIVDAGFDANSAVYKMAAKAYAQNPHPPQVKVGRRLQPFTQTLNLTPVNTTEGFEYALNVLCPNGDTVPVSFEVQPGDTVALICDDLVTALTAAPAVKNNGGAAAPYVLTDGMTLIVRVDDTISVATFNTADFVDIGAATAAEVVIVLDTDIAGADASGDLVLTSDSMGPNARIKILGGTAMAALGFDKVEVYGSGCVDLTVVDNTTHVTVTADNDGELYNFQWLQLDPIDDLLIDDNTLDPGLSDDLDAIADYDDDWYGIVLDSNSPAENVVLAGWLESKRKIGVVQSSNSDVVDPDSVTDNFSLMVNAAYSRILPMYSKSELLDYRCVAIMAEELTKTPGSSTWAHKTLASIGVDTMRGALFAAVHLDTKRGTTYTRIGGLNKTFEGKTPKGEYIDIPHFVDWLYARIQERAFGLISTQPNKLPFTDASVSLVIGVIEGVLEEGRRNNGLKPGFKVTGPKVADVSLFNRANRILPDIAFSAELAGAIHRTIIRGVVTV